MGKGLKITPVLGGLSGKWRSGNGTALVATEPGDEIDWPLGEMPPAPATSTPLHQQGFTSHFADNPHARETFEQGLQERELQLRPSRAYSALTHEGG